MATDVLIVGAGPVGLALALALRDSGLAVRLADARARSAVADDPRVLALAHGSRLSLEQLGVWGRFPVTPIRHIHVSQRGGLGRTRIDADEEGVPALGYVTAAGDLAAALRAAVDHAGIPIMDETEVSAAQAEGDYIDVPLTGAGTAQHGPHCQARLLACAEGAMRAEGDGAVMHDYGQHAIICVAHTADCHDSTAYERFTPEGPIALLPHGDAYAVVHVVAPDEATTLLALDDDAYRASLQARFGTRVRFTAIGARQRYPLHLRYRRAPTAARTVWIGNAAQTLHPVAGQGFNLALRDVHALARSIRDHAGDPGAPALLETYARARRMDRHSTIGLTDLLVRTFSNDFAPLHHLRGAALLALDLVPPLRSVLARRFMFGLRQR